MHEFGHALGLQHEQYHPDSKVIINPNKYDSSDIYVFPTEYDLASVMHYEYRPEHTSDGKGTNWNTELSDGDKAIIGKIYPPLGDRYSITEKRIYTLENALDIFIDQASGRIIFYPLKPNRQIDPVKNDRYKILDSEKESFFTSKTRFRIRNITKLRGGIRIMKNGYNIHKGWIYGFTKSYDPNMETIIYTLEGSLDIIKMGDGRIFVSTKDHKSQINSFKDDRYIITDHANNRFDFTSKTYFNSKTNTGLTAPISIIKNDQRMTGWVGSSED